MAVKSRSAIGLFLMALVCLFSYCGHIFFETVVSVCVLYVCLRSIYGLCMYNFATDEMLFRYEQNLALKAGVLTEDIFVIRIKNMFLTLLFIIYFAGAFAFAPNSFFKVLYLSALLMWIFDLVKTVAGYFKRQENEEWTCVDSVFEAIMWIQNILSVVLAIFKLITI